MVGAGKQQGIVERGLDRPRPGERTVHQAHGLRIRSELPLPGLPGGAAGDADVALRWQAPAPVPAQQPTGEPLLHLEVDGATRYVAARGGHVYRLRFPGCCDFTVDTDLRSVGCRRDPAVTPELVSILAAGALMSFVLTMAGQAVLHASAVEIDGAAVGVVGASGFGKSTVAALLCAGGCDLVTDDVLRVDIDDLGAPVVAHAGASELRLRPTVRALAGAFPTAVAARDTADGRLALRPPRTSRSRLPLGALVVPRVAAPGDVVSVRRLPAAQALVHLLAFPRLLGWTSREVLRRQFEQLATLADRVPVLEAHVPGGPPFTADAGRRLAAALAAATRRAHARPAVAQ